MLAVYAQEGEAVSQLLFTMAESGIELHDAFRARYADLYENHARLSVSGDFNGDGSDEIAFFEDMLYKPNMNPHYSCSAVSIMRSAGDHLLPAGTWFSQPDSSLSFAQVDYTVAADYNQDGFCDIALWLNDPESDHMYVAVLESDGSGFSEPMVWYSCLREEFNFTALRHAIPGDFNGNGKPDIAVFYDYFGTAPGTRQAVYVFESDGKFFSLLPVAYDGTIESYDFSRMKQAMAGDYNGDGCSDIAVLYEDPSGQDLLIPVFEGSEGGQLSPVDYISFSGEGPDPSHVLYAAGGQFAGDPPADLVLYYDHPGTGKQEILLLESMAGSFEAPVTIYSVDEEILSMSDIASVHSGKYYHQPVVRATTWKDNRRGALSFTFDDGYRGAFEHGGAELEAAGLKGTFYIFTDTLSIYDGELASTNLVREYREMGHEIGSHTSNHSNLGWLAESGNLDSIYQVLSASKELLDQRFDQFTMTMSIPFGSFRHATLEHISRYYYSARSSQFGFNLATPADFFALKSWPVLSTTSPAYVDNLLSMAEEFGTYLPLMYHDLVDEPFDEDLHIYTYSRELFRETLQDAALRDLWIDTHERIYKYIRERNALKINFVETEERDQTGGNFSFVADDGLADSIFNVAVSLKIAVPPSWTGDTLTVGPRGDYSHLEVQGEGSDGFVLYDWIPAGDDTIQVYDGILNTTGMTDRKTLAAAVSVTAFPNPFHRETQIRVNEGNIADTYLIVMDMHGRALMELREPNGDSFILSGESLDPGIYLVQLIRKGTALASLKLLVL